MMLRQGWAFETSPHGASQTIFRPGMSGVPDIRAVVARSGDCASAGENNATTQSAVASRRKFIDGASGESRLRRACAAAVLASGPAGGPAAETPQTPHGG